MKQILVRFLFSLKQAIVSLFKKRKHRVKIDSNHDGNYDIVIDINTSDNEDQTGGIDYDR